MIASPPAAVPHERFDRVDALRGAAMLWMAAFHFAFDLNHFGLLDPRQDFYRDPLWTTQRTAIVEGARQGETGRGQAERSERGRRSGAGGDGRRSSEARREEDGAAAQAEPGWKRDGRGLIGDV